MVKKVELPVSKAYQPTCAVCKFWVEDNGGSFGECRFLPPFVSVFPAGTSQCRVMTQPDYWCGQHQKRDSK